MSNDPNTAMSLLECDVFVSCAGAMDRVQTNRVSEWYRFYFSSNHNQIHSIRMARFIWTGFFFFLNDDKPEWKQAEMK